MALAILTTHTDIFNTSNFMEELSKKQQKLRFGGAGASYQNGAGRRARYQYIGQYGSAILMQACMICHKDTLSIDFVQRRESAHFDHLD